MGFLITALVQFLPLVNRNYRYSELDFEAEAARHRLRSLSQTEGSQPEYSSMEVLQSTAGSSYSLAALAVAFIVLLAWKTRRR
jgi:hypothetical protein